MENNVHSLYVGSAYFAGAILLYGKFRRYYVGNLWIFVDSIIHNS